MNLKEKWVSWKYPFLLLFGVGLSNVGDWIYLIALNLIILDMTGSPLAVAMLYILKPLAVLCTNFWSGSMIDRLNQRNLMVGLDILRAILIALLPIFSSIWVMYVLVLLINMAGSVCEPTSMAYITKLVSPGSRRRFNSLRSLVDSGGFLIGPAIAGLLFMIGSPWMAIYVNAVTFLGSGFIIFWLPELKKSPKGQLSGKLPSIDLLKKDWKIVYKFSRNYSYVMAVYFLFGLMMVMAAALDSLEAAFATEVLSLSDTKYGFLVSIAGAGIASGAIVNALMARKLSIQVMIGMGSLFVSGGYIIYAFSSNFNMAALGFFILSFSLAFAYTGFHTFYQENIPVDVMGRVGSIYGILEAVCIIGVTAAFGVAAQLITIQVVVIAGSFLMLGTTVILCLVSFYSAKRIASQTIERNSVNVR
ncbi:MFS transporter [Halobacillus naozhouensis]|uniref:MFS transporter n=1 Tax=Halobacillus naozhouensis TaxID=554880 RepID=A0ABY8J0P4_9BACI|nr:MFS transporter [Halobacillus naozhouensis]WFT76067.1 MFS transporter [Halobacillus naozhouensis]